MIFRGPNFSVTPQRLWDNTAVVRFFLFGISKGSGWGGKKRPPRIGFSGSKGDFGDFEVVEGSVVDVLLHKSSLELCVLFFWSINDPGKSGFF